MGALQLELADSNATFSIGIGSVQELPDRFLPLRHCPWLISDATSSLSCHLMLLHHVHSSVSHSILFFFSSKHQRIVLSVLTFQTSEHVYTSQINFIKFDYREYSLVSNKCIFRLAKDQINSFQI